MGRQASVLFLRNRAGRAFRHKEKLLRASASGDPDKLESMYHAILRRIEMFKEDWVAADHWEAALNYCRDVDADDAPHVAITLALNGLLWTGDTKLKKGLRAKGFERFFEPE